MLAINCSTAGKKLTSVLSHTHANPHLTSLLDQVDAALNASMTVPLAFANYATTRLKLTALPAIP